MASDKVVLICATGRSGSSTLQRIINTIPNSNMCGENHGALNSLLEFYMNLHITSSQNVVGNYNPIPYELYISKNIKPSWYNSYNMKDIEDCLRETIIKMFKKDENNVLWGFKEIRYNKKKIKLLTYFKRLFPQTKVIIQIRRDIISQSKSSWYSKNKKSAQYLLTTNNDFFEFYNNNKDWCYFTTFESMFNRNNLENMFKFIGCGESFNELEVKKILDNNIKD